jgi:hypothetical protein
VSGADLRCEPESKSGATKIQARRNEIKGKRNKIKIAFLAADRAFSKGCARFPVT